MIRRLAARLPQVEVGWLGGLKTIAGRLTFYRGILTFLMLIPVAYNAPLVQQFFPTLWLFAAALFGVLAVAAVVEYAVIYPSQLTFQKRQAARNDRDPIHKRVRELQDQQQELLDVMQTREPMTPDGGEVADSDAETDTHE